MNDKILESTFLKKLDGQQFADTKTKRDVRVQKEINTKNNRMYSQQHIIYN